MVERYVSMASVSLNSDLQLFCGIVHAKAGERLRASGSLNYTRVREFFLAKFTSLGFDTKQFASGLGEHRQLQTQYVPVLFLLLNYNL